MATIPTKEQYKKALEAIKDSISENQMKMLKFHYFYMHVIALAIPANQLSGAGICYGFC